jgi:uncharacterized protein (TIGR03032 family)
MTDHPAIAASPETEQPFQHSHSPEFAEILHHVQGSLLVTTYQAGKLAVMRSKEGRLQTLFRSFPQPMGLAVEPHRLALGTQNQVWFFQNAQDIAPQVEPLGVHDACFLPRRSHVTGDIRGHEMGWVGDDLWIVNTRFSCLCTTSPEYSFVPRWQPPFVTELVAEDRCHLNGLAFDERGPKYVTALGETNAADGWRPGKASGGCVIDVGTSQIVTRGLSMPHSPRLYGGDLWVLESGRGRLVRVDRANGQITEIATFPGYARGLEFAGRFAFIGLSKIREKSIFGGLPISEQKRDLRCGVWVVDLKSGACCAFVEFTTNVEEIFEVRLLRGFQFPTVVGFQKPTINGAFIVPPEVLAAGAASSM